MEVFDSIDEAITPSQVANEWRVSLPHSTPGPAAEPIAPSYPHTVSFEDGLRTIVECYTRLCAIGSAKISDASPMLTVFDDALSQVASVEAGVSSLLALRGERAMVMLEAIQMYLHTIAEHHPRRRGAIHLLIKLAHRSGQLPTSLFVGQVTLQQGSRPLCGGFGDVHPGILAGQTVAVKKFRNIGGDDATHQRLCREALVWRQLRHANILPFIGLNKEIFPEDPLPALVSPWMKNGSLRDYVRSPKYNAASEVSLLLSGIANGIAYLHALTITHGDIKHLNILVDNACCPRLADFGLVRLNDSVTAGGFTHTTNGFDFRWTSPQRLNEEVRGPSDDVYSFGCVGYYLYAGRVPFEGTTESGTLMRVMRGERPSRPSSGDKYSLEPSDDAWELISRCWAHESDARPKMAEVCSLLIGAVAVPSSGGYSQSASDFIISKHVERQSCVHYHSNLVFKASNWVDMDLLNENRALVHAGKLVCQWEADSERNGWSELFILLFDNYLVLTNVKEKDGITKYHVAYRPIPLDFLTLGSFSDAPTQDVAAILQNPNADSDALGTNRPMLSESQADARALYPCTIHHHKRVYTLYADGPTARAKWREVLEMEIKLHLIAQDNLKVFKAVAISSETFSARLLHSAAVREWDMDMPLRTTVTCSVPFKTSDGRALIAIGCEEGLWIDFRDDPQPLRVLDIKRVTQCAVLEDFGIFLVLADKSLLAYHIEALVPTTIKSARMSKPAQMVSGTQSVQCFRVGSLGGRTIVIYIEHKDIDGTRFHILEPVVENINKRAWASTSLGSLFGLIAQRSDWFRIYQSGNCGLIDTYDVVFLKTRIAVLYAGGFMIIEIGFPRRDDPCPRKLWKSWDESRPLGIFHLNADQFLLCYQKMGMYVDQHGDPLRTASRNASVVRWEGTAERAAHHPPFVLLFDSEFIEIRHVETGRLVQIMLRDRAPRCIWDGQAATLDSDDDRQDADDRNQEARVHAVVYIPTGHWQSGVIRQIIELVPTDSRSESLVASATSWGRLHTYNPNRRCLYERK